MIPICIKYLTVSQNEDNTYNIVYIVDIIDGDELYEDCEVVIPRAVTINDNLLSFPYYNNEEEIFFVISIPEEYR